jgi:hypothetical protein
MRGGHYPSKSSSDFHRTHSSFVQFVQLSDQQIAKEHPPNRFCRWLEPNWVSYKCLADKPFPAAPSYLSIAAHAPNRPSARVIQLHGTRARSARLIQRKRQPKHI